MAERRRRDGDAADDPRDEARDDEAFEADDALDDDVAEDELIEDDDAEDDDDDRATGARGAAAGGTTTKARPRSTVPAGRKSTRGKGLDRPNVFARLINFIREVVAELRKVIWPTRKELLTYTSVVVVFVVIMLTIVGSLDYGFARAVLWVFGNKTTPAPTGEAE